jgi:hypothetical protein
MRLSFHRWSVVLLALTTQACEERTQFSREATLRTEPTSIDLGGVYVGSEREALVALSAPGTIPVPYRIRLEGDAFGYQVGPAVGRVSANGTVALSVVFRPSEPGRREAIAIIEASGSDSATTSFQMYATGIAVPDCEDGNGCTDDVFDAELGRCISSAREGSCQDLNPCTTDDRCVDGVCLGEGSNCTDDNPCTDDFCDPQQGCVHISTVACNDNNPCTVDQCNPDGSCGYQTLPDGTPCDDFEPCTFAEICLFGGCEGVAIPDGVECDDGDPCSTEERCTEGRCEDPNYDRPEFGEIKFVTDLPDTLSSSSNNPIVDRDGTIYVGTASGVTAVDRCGDVLWSNVTAGPSRFSAALANPSTLAMPQGSDVVELRLADGQEVNRFGFRLLVPPIAATSTVRLDAIDVASRSSGALVVSVAQVITTATTTTRRGFIAETDATRTSVRMFRQLGSWIAERIAVDADESVLAILTPAEAITTTRATSLVRFGLSNLENTSWSVEPLEATRSELALGPDGEVFWTVGLVRVSKHGMGALLFPASTPSDAVDYASPVIGRNEVCAYRAQTSTETVELACIRIDGEPGARPPIVLDSDAKRFAPVFDQEDVLYTLSSDGRLLGFDAQADILLETSLASFAPFPLRLALTISPDGVILAVLQDRIVGVQSRAPLSGSSWPRHRRDNLSTGHR